MEDGSRRDRALVAATSAFMHLTRRHIASARPAATWATETIRPTLPTQLLATLLAGAKLCPKLLHRQHLSTRFAL